jgi:O-antigen/teichoic acid export membrane protein
VIRWALIDQAAVSAGNFLVGIWMARLLDAPGLAQYALALTTILGLSTIHRAWVAQPMNVLGATESPARRFTRYDNMLRAQCWLLPAMALMAGLIGAAFFPQPALIGGMVLFLSLFCLQDLARRYHYTHGDIGQAVPGDVLAYGGQLLLLVCLWAATYTPDVDTVFWVLSVPMLAAWAWMHWRIAAQDATPRDATTPRPTQDLREHWHNAKWVVWSQVVWIGASQLVPFQLAAFSSSDDVAAYHAANTLMNALNVLRLTMGNYLPASAAKVFAEQSYDGLRRYLWRVGMFCGALSIAAYIFLDLTGDFWIDLLFAGKYDGAKAIVPTMAAIHLLAMSSLISAAGAQVVGTTRVIFTSNVVALVFTWGLGTWLIAHWGLWGSVMVLAIGLLLPAIVQALHLQIFLSKQQCRRP